MANQESTTAVMPEKKERITDQNFKATILVDNTPTEVFNAINNVRGWWSENIQGKTDSLNAEFFYHYKDIHNCKIKIIELDSGKKIVWRVLENHFNFTKDQTEWKGDDIVFDIVKKDEKTKIEFTHHGLTPAYECYDVCNDAWTGYITKSLYNLIVKGEGQPTPKGKEGEFNEELIRKWKLNDVEKTESFTYSFESSKSAKVVYETLLNVNAWWSGLYEEQIKGVSKKLNDEFTFHAGDGAHYSKQKLIELVPNKKVVWLVTESNLSFLENPEEWTNTKICFDIAELDGQTLVTFTHQDLIPKIECYKSCTSAWSQYLENLAKDLK